MTSKKKSVHVHDRCNHHGINYIFNPQWIESTKVERAGGKVDKARKLPCHKQKAKHNDGKCENRNYGRIIY